MYPLFAEAHISMDKAADHALVLRALEGDSAAFETLVCRYTRVVMTLSRRITGSLEDAEDVAQQAFMKALINLSRFRFHCAFSTWLVSIAINEARMWTRKRRRSREVPMAATAGEDGSVIVFDWPDERPDPESVYLRKESDQLLRSELKRLAPTSREAIEICDLQQLSTADTALSLGVTVAAVKSRRSRGRAALRRRLERQLCRECAWPSGRIRVAPIRLDVSNDSSSL